MVKLYPLRRRVIKMVPDYEPEFSRIVEELNRAAPGGAPPPSAETVVSSQLDELLDSAARCTPPT